ncbi:DNA repair protein RecO [Arcanobacterium wilhelmae]|uniref:DNA repair protein RecO n=1 Tax=Arcanobacterium wilhelmae TaxID=1803177 RepID=UPI00241565C3|nr:DNA repair protein RecO [Arcanobacterium wilhelmae]WFN91139.1 DNA repair protein RecO [Arcanobacterium wilhelmae]
MSVKTYRVHAIVLRHQDLGEADRIVTLFTRERGIVRAVAKGVRRTKSRFGARLEPFSLVDLQLYEGRSLDVVTQAESIHQFGRKIVASYEAYTSASAMVEVTERLLPAEGEPDAELFRLLHGALAAVASGDRAPDLLMNSYIVRALAHAGWELAIFECAKCAIEGPHEAFNVYAGGAVCDDCRPAGSATPSVETWQLLAALSVGDWRIATQADESARKAAAGLIAAYAQFQIERSVRSLKLANR